MRIQQEKAGEFLLFLFIFKDKLHIPSVWAGRLYFLFDSQPAIVYSRIKQTVHTG
jgi:hypothetical protein